MLVKYHTRQRNWSFSMLACVALIAGAVFFVAREIFNPGWNEVDHIEMSYLADLTVGNTPIGNKIEVRAQHQTNTLQEKSFYDIGLKTNTDKVLAKMFLPACLKNESSCIRPGCEREECRPWGHYYHSMYQQKIGKMTLPGTEPFQFLEIGYFRGSGYDAFNEFFSDVKGVELHSFEISCLPPGPLNEGKWPWGNTATANKQYDNLLKNDLLHCGDASDVNWLHEIYTTKMKRHDAPPLKVVVEDASHMSSHIVQSVFFWFPRIEPGGFLFIEDIQPIREANQFRTQFMAQIHADLHFCGDPDFKDEACFPTLYPLLQSIHCEMHICVFERNDRPALYDLSIEESTSPPNALDLTKCFSFSNRLGPRV